MGEMNTAPQAKDAHEAGIRRGLEKTSKKAVLKSELPSCSKGEREEFEQLTRRMGLVDAFEHQRDSSKGRHAKGRQRYTQYSHGNLKAGVGQRIDLVLTDMPMIESIRGEAVVVSVSVLEDVKGSDHKPVETVIELAAVATGEQGGSTGERALGSEREGQDPVSQKDKFQGMEGTKVLVVREELVSVAADESRRRIPATIKVVMGQLIRVKVDIHWLKPRARLEQGVTAQGIEVMKLGTCPTRYVLGEEVMHYKSKKRGTVETLTLGAGT